MKISTFLDKDLVLADLSAGTKSEVLAEMLEPMAAKFPVIDPGQALVVLLEREGLGTTGIGDGVAIPHGKLPGLAEVAVAVGRSRGGADFEALDHKPCHVFVLILAPDQAAGLHLRILAHVSRLLRDPSFRRAFLEAQDLDALWELLQAA